MIADPLWSYVMLLSGPLWVFCGSFAVFSHTRSDVQLTIFTREQTAYFTASLYN